MPLSWLRRPFRPHDFRGFECRQALKDDLNVPGGHRSSSDGLRSNTFRKLRQSREEVRLIRREGLEQRFLSVLTREERQLLDQLMSKLAATSLDLAED